MRSSPSEPSPRHEPVRVLVVDDEALVRRSVLRQLREPEFEALEADDGETALQALKEGGIDVVLADVMMPRLNGMELLRRVREASYDVEVIMMTAHDNLSLAFEAVHAGAFHFLKKPITTEELRLHVLRATERRRMAARARHLEAELDGARRMSPSVGSSRAMRDVIAFVSKVAPRPSTVLITGECGTGKELIAREIHATSPRARRMFVPVNCGAIPEGLVESTFFGSVRGAFNGAEDRAGVFEAADGGTVFLDEIGELPKSQQVKLLRVLQERKVTRVGEVRERDVDVRVLAATNVDIAAAVAAQRFRSDLYFRINAETVEVPPLRERREDIQALAYHFVQKHAARHNPKVARISPMALRALESYGWPGNVRELENAVISGLGNARGDTIELDCLPKVIRGVNLSAVPSQSPDPRGSARLDLGLDYNVARRRALAEFERAYVKNIMELSQGNISEAARVAGLDRSNFRRVLRRAQGNGEGEGEG